MDSTERDFEQRVAERAVPVAVLGLGRVGRPLAAALARAGFPVLGCDPDPERRAACAGEAFETTGASAALAEADAFLICVPTPLGPEREPDLAFVAEAAATVAGALAARRARGAALPALVVLESTVWPGCTREVVGGALAARGLVSERDFLLAYSPERIDPGAHEAPAEIPKLVGGATPAAARAARALYAAFVREVHVVSSPEVAEAAKLLENVFRAVNIALVNELKGTLDALGIDVWEVVEAAATKPFGFMKFTPGPGLGGHCLPVDPFYLAWIARRAGAPARFVELAGEIHRAAPEYVVERTRAALAERGRALAGARLLILGLAYKRGVDDCRESPAVRLFERFSELGAAVRYSDPRVPRAPAEAGARLAGEVSLALDEATVAAFDAVVLATDQPELDLELVARSARLVVDTRGALRGRIEPGRYRSA